MSREPGPREQQQRDLAKATRERKNAGAIIDMSPLPKAVKTSLKTAIAEAAKKRGRPRKAKK